MQPIYQSRDESPALYNTYDELDLTQYDAFITSLGVSDYARSNYTVNLA